MSSIVIAKGFAEVGAGWRNDVHEKLTKQTDELNRREVQN